MGDHSEEEIRQRKLTAYCTQKDKENSNQEEKPDLEVKKEQKKCTKYFTIYLPRKLVYLSVLVVVIASVIIYVPRTYFLPEDESPYTTLGQEGAALFRRYDRNGDDHLSVSEYEALYHQLVGKGLNISEIEYIPEQKIQEGDEMLTLRAYFKPLLIETMTKDMAENFFGQMESLTGLKEWTTANQESLNFGVQHFSVFFPVGAIEVGQIYELFTDGRSSFMSSISSSHLSSNRFYPTKAEDKLIVIQRILSMFHPRPFLVSRFPPKGGVALVRAVGEEYIDIVFRIHAEFQLNEPPFNPFWFTPGQFTGNLIVTKDYNHIVYFNVYVPNDKKLNVDMEWLNGPSENENMEVDIGYMPLMQANISAPSREWRFPSEAETPVDIDNSVLDIVQNIQWSYEISEEEALRLLEVKMYPFKQVKYYNFTETLTKAKEENKLIHSILLWGALDDQSC